MDKPDTMQGDGTVEPGKDKPAGGFGRRMIMGILVFWVLVLIVFIVFRYPYIFSQLVGGGEDRPLLAIVSAELNNNVLNIEFIRSMPDQPGGVFIVGGHLPPNTNSSDPELENRITGSDLVINGEAFEILFESVDSARLPGRQSGLTIEWSGKERGTISLDLADSYAFEEISANRAFVVVARSAADFRISNIIHN